MERRSLCRIALIECDPAAAAALMSALRGAGHSCRRFAGGSDTPGELADMACDLLLIGRISSDTDPAEVIVAARGRFGYGLPIIAIVSPAHPEDFVHALDEGADYCLVRPVAGAVLLAQINAALRRGTSAGPRVEASIGHLRLEPEGLRAYLDDELVELTAKEYALALLLCRNLGVPLGREHILATIWGDDVAPSTRTLDVHVSRLRTKLELRPDRGFTLAALYGRGYRLDFSGAAPAAVEKAMPPRPVRTQPAQLSGQP